jgi:protein-tyrosine phosphatase
MTDPVTEPDPGASIPLKTLPNLRDVGGWPTRDGRRVRRGMLFRSTELGKLDAEDRAALAGLELRTVFDLRTAGEREKNPDRLPEGAQGVVADVLADMDASVPPDLLGLLADPELTTQMLGGGRATAAFLDAYRDLIRLPSALAAYRTFFTELGDPDRVPALYHCTTGKDRTGWGTAALLTILGVDEEHVYREYLLTNDQLLPALKPLLDQFDEAGGDSSLLIAVLGVDRSYLETAFDEVRTRYGTVEDYFTEGLGIEAAAQDELRDRYLEPAD